MSSRKVWVNLLLAVSLAGGSYLVWHLAWHGWAAHHRRLAEAALARRDFSGASAHLRVCLRVWPEDGDVYFLAAQTARRQGNMDEAARLLRACSTRSGSTETVELEYLLIRVHDGDMAETNRLMALYLEHTDRPEAPLVLEAVIDGSLRGLEPAFLRSQTFGGGAAEAQLARTMQAVEQWLRLRPDAADQAQGLCWRGTAQAYANEQDSAVAAFRRALDLDPDHFDARLLLAKSLVQDAPREAADHFEILRQRRPHDTQVRLWVAYLRRSTGKLEEARQMLDEILTADPDNNHALVERAQVALDMGQPEDAEARLRRALTHAPDDPKIHLALIVCLRALGRPGEAQIHQAWLEQHQAQRRKQPG